MAKKLVFNIFMILCSFILSLLLSSPSQSLDPGPLQDFCVADLKSHVHVNGYPCKNTNNVASQDFFFEGFQHELPVFDRLGVNVTQGNVNAFPALNTLGISMNRVQLVSGGLNPPHTHPRATELSLLVEGEIFVGFVSTANVLYGKGVTAGELFVIPPGVVHFQINVGQGNALFYASFNSQQPGIQKIATSLFASTPLIPDEVLAVVLNVNDTIIDIIRSRLAELKSSHDCFDSQNRDKITI